jgi:trimethylamine:corrinoid methyltransferase-like protein
MDLYADVAAVGPGGHFLASKNTRKAARSPEFYMSELLDRHTYEAWIELGKPRMYTRARDRVHEILAAPMVDALPAAVSARLGEILAAADAEGLRLK